MIIKYIDRNGNWAETADIVHIPANLYEIDKVWFEKREEVKAKEVKVKEEKEVAPSEVEEGVVAELQEKAKEFLKEKKVKGYGLLKGDNLVKKAREEGFNL